MKRYLPFIVMLFFSSCWWDNDEPTPPSTEEIKLWQDYAFNIQAGNKLVANVDPFTQVDVGDPNCDPNHNNNKAFDIIWQMTDNTEYIDITILDHSGVNPDIQRAYSLQSFYRNVATSNHVPLVMQQAATATEKLFQVTWRFKLNATEDIPAEICNGQIYPDIGGTPFERKFKANTTIGDTWVLTIPANINPESITATITYHLHKLNFPHCL